MGIHVVWDNAQKTIVRMDVGAWGWNDVSVAFEEFRALLSTTTPPVDLIVNVLNANVLPLQGALTNLQYMFNMIPYRVVFVGTKPIGRAMFEVLAKVHPFFRQKIFFTATLDEARALLAVPQKQA